MLASLHYLNFLLNQCQPHAQFLLHAGMACLCKVLHTESLGLGLVTFWPGSPTQRLLDEVIPCHKAEDTVLLGEWVWGVQKGGRVSWLYLKYFPNGCTVSLWLHQALPFRQ